MKHNVSTLTKEEEDQIYTMFFGPYKPEWKDKIGNVDNTDSAIAKRLGLKISVVANRTSTICNDHFKRIIRIRKTI